MNCDRAKRLKLRTALSAYMRGEIRTFAFDDANSECVNSSDHDLARVAKHLYQIHDDTVDHSISVPQLTWDRLNRVVAFLDTDTQCEQNENLPYWPFPNNQAWVDQQATNSHLDIPEYDRHLHQIRIHGPLSQIPTPIGVAILIFIAIIGLAFIAIAT